MGSNLIWLVSLYEEDIEDRLVQREDSCENIGRK